MGLFDQNIETIMPSISVKYVDQQQFTVALAAFLKKSGKVKLPEWVDLVKTNVAKELAPYDEDWYYTRSASSFRTIETCRKRRKWWKKTYIARTQRSRQNRRTKQAWQESCMKYNFVLVH